MIYILGIVAIAIVSIMVSNGKDNIDQKKIVAKKDHVASPSPSLSSTPIPTAESPIKPLISPSPSKQPINGSLQYPNSVKVKTSGNISEYESTDHPDQITNWYKDKIKSMNMNAKSFVTTNTNGNVLNKLVGTNGQNEIRVEVSKNENSSVVKIRVEVNFAIDISNAL